MAKLEWMVGSELEVRQELFWGSGEMISCMCLPAHYNQLQENVRKRTG